VTLLDAGAEVPRDLRDALLATRTPPGASEHRMAFIKY
jgi:hypothetical protein